MQRSEEGYCLNHQLLSEDLISMTSIPVSFLLPKNFSKLQLYKINRHLQQAHFHLYIERFK
jgi:hypothetical protein